MKKWVVRFYMPAKNPVTRAFGQKEAREVVEARFFGTEAEMDKFGYMLAFCSVGQCNLAVESDDDPS